MSRPLSIIARDIQQAWPKPYFGAVPYLRALSQLTTIKDHFGADDAYSIVLYFLSNAGSFRGVKAKALKAELQGLL